MQANLNLSGKFFASQIQMLLASPKVRAARIGPSRVTHSLLQGVQSVVIPNRQTRDVCVYELSKLKTMQLEIEPSMTSGEENVYIVYVARSKPEAEAHNREVQIMHAHEFASKKELFHVDLSSMDLDPKQFALSPAIPRLRSLDMSRLQLEDDVIATVIRFARFRNLRWLDLSGNPRLTYATVETIARSIASGALPNLIWLDLLGTGCDASPYIDGFYWRMTEPAQHLAAVYGYQRWMMLGSRIPEMANRELLPANQRVTRPDRFNLP